MELEETQLRIWRQVKSELKDEAVAGPDHVERMTTWSQRIGRKKGADLDVLTAGALIHDIGVTVDRSKHYLAGRDKAERILSASGLSKEKVNSALHVMESHSRYGGPDPVSLEAQVGQDADALEYIGAIGIIRAVVRGLKDGSFDGRVSGFPEYLRSILTKVEGSFHTAEAEETALGRIRYMGAFLDRLEKELNFDL